MKSNFEIFKQLHYSTEPLILANAWDARSARVFAESGFAAIATSSGAVAEALGSDDGEQLSFDELHFVVEHICRAVELPVTVDIEGGYSVDIYQICKNIERLVDLGVVGINFEDSMKGGTREILPAETVAETIRDIKDFCRMREIEIFLNLRTDTYLLNVDNRFEETMERIRIFGKAGADGIFIPCLIDLKEMAEFTNATTLPINVMCLPDLPDFEALKNAGIHRVSMGPFMANYLASSQAEASKRIIEDGSFDALFE